MRVLNYCRSKAERDALTMPEAEARRMAALSAQDSDLIIELNVTMKIADLGGADAARRVAELYEMAEDPVGARPWWRAAADLGDPDAEAYVKRIVDASAPAAAQAPDAAAAADD